MQVHIKNLIDDVQCDHTVRELRWPDGVASPFCESQHVIKCGFEDMEPARQREECPDCEQRFDDLTDPLFAGYHHPLKMWIWCLYGMAGFGSLWRSWLRPHRGISQEKLPLSLGFFEFVPHVRRRGKALLGALIERLVC